MAGEHIKPMKDAIAAMRAARREAIKKLNLANNEHNRSEFLQIDQTLKALQQVLQEEKAMD